MSREQVEAFREAVVGGLRRCRVEDGSPVALIPDRDHFHISYMVTQAILDSPAFRTILADERAAALREAADSLEWKRPEVCPCVEPEACCGSEESCDAMQPLTRAVGADWLRARADEVTR